MFLIDPNDPFRHIYILLINKYLPFMMECMAVVSVVANCSWYFQHIDMSKPEKMYWILILVCVISYIENL
jgi:hypothetical protein